MTGIRMALSSLAAASVLAASPVLGESEHAHHDHAAMAGNTASSAEDPHAAHRAMMQSPSYEVTQAQYAIPDVTLQDQAGRPVALRELFSGERPVAVNFIYTSCTTICPVMTATMLQLQRELGDSATGPVYISISIDPDFDTAATLGAYASRFGADWTFLTGQRDEVLGVLSAFDAWRGSKANHAAITLFRPAGAAHWTRVEGLASARQLADIWQAGLG